MYDVSSSKAFCLGPLTCDKSNGYQIESFRAIGVEQKTYAISRLAPQAQKEGISKGQNARMPSKMVAFAEKCLFNYRFFEVGFT